MWLVIILCKKYLSKVYLLQWVVVIKRWNILGATDFETWCTVRHRGVRLFGWFQRRNYRKIGEKKHCRRSVYLIHWIGTSYTDGYTQKVKIHAGFQLLYKALSIRESPWLHLSLMVWKNFSKYFVEHFSRESKKKLRLGQVLQDVPKQCCRTCKAWILNFFIM